MVGLYKETECVMGYVLLYINLYMCTTVLLCMI